jgi:UDP-glucose 4-epimerase
MPSVSRTYLVTGGCGFIGSRLVRELARRGHRVRVLDDLSTGDEAALPDGVELAVADVADAAAVRAAMRGADGCFHLAAVASVERTRRDWLAAHRTNSGGTVTVLEAARDAAPAPVPVVYASSAAVYGDATEPPAAEDSPPAPPSASGVDKLAGELHARTGARLFGAPTLGLRFFNVYGPGQRADSPYSGVISLFCDRLSRGLPVTVYGDGRQTRDFVHVDDVVRALAAGMERLPAGGRVANVCTGTQTSVLELARTIADLLGAPLRVEHGPARAGDIRRSAGDPRLLADLLGVSAATPLRDGLARTLAWWREAGSPGVPQNRETRQRRSA